MTLNYIGSKYFDWLYILFVLSILQWFITIFFVFKNRNILFDDIEGFQDIKIKISFIKDYFYQFWNIYPIVFYLFFYYIQTMWNTWMVHIMMITNSSSNIIKSYEILFGEKGLKVDIFLLSILVIGSFYSAFFVQKNKQDIFIKSTKIIYWWDIRINKYIYWVRAIFLFLNLILISYLTLIVTKIAIFILSILFLENLNIFPFHPDGYAGLKVLMEISSVIISIYLLRSSMGIIGYMDHKGQGIAHKITDIYNISYLPLGIIFLIILINKVKDLLFYAYEKYNLKNLLSSDNYQNWINKFQNDVNNTSEILDSLDKYSSSIQNYYSVLNFNKFPIDLTLFVNSIFTWILPISFWFLFNFFEHYYKQR